MSWRSHPFCVLLCMPGAGCWEIPTASTEPSRSSAFPATIQNARGSPADWNVAWVQNGPTPLPFIVQGHLACQCTLSQMQDVVPTEGRDSKGVSCFFACLFRGCKHRSADTCSTLQVKGRQRQQNPISKGGCMSFLKWCLGGTFQKSQLPQEHPCGTLQLCSASWAEQSFWLISSSLNATSILPMAGASHKHHYSGHTSHLEQHCLSPNGREASQQ